MKATIKELAISLIGKLLLRLLSRDLQNSEFIVTCNKCKRSIVSLSVKSTFPRITYTHVALRNERYYWIDEDIVRNNP